MFNLTNYSFGTGNGEYYILISEGVETTAHIDAIENNLVELESLLSTNPETLIGKIKVLSSDKYELIDYDEWDEPGLVKVFNWIPGDYNLSKELRDFCDENNLDLKQIIVSGEFYLLD